MSLHLPHLDILFCELFCHYLCVCVCVCVCMRESECVYECVFYISHDELFGYNIVAGTWQLSKTLHLLITDEFAYCYLQKSIILIAAW